MRRTLLLGTLTATVLCIAVTVFVLGFYSKAGATQHPQWQYMWIRFSGSRDAISIATSNPRHLMRLLGDEKITCSEYSCSIPTDHQFNGDEVEAFSVKVINLLGGEGWVIFEIERPADGFANSMIFLICPKSEETGSERIPSA